MTFQVSTTSQSFDPSIYSVTTCGDGNTCIPGAASDDCFATELPQPAGCEGSTSTEIFGPFMYNPGTYFFYIDSFYSSVSGMERSFGDYTLTVTGNLPVELLEFTVD